MKKLSRVLALSLAFIMLIGTTTFAAVPNNSVTIGNRAISIDYIFNYLEDAKVLVNSLLDENPDSSIFFQLDGQNERFTDPFTGTEATEEDLAEVSVFIDENGEEQELEQKELEVVSVSAIDANNILVTFEGVEEPVEIALEEALENGATTVTFEYEDVLYEDVELEEAYEYNAEELAQEAVENAEETKEQDDVDAARELVDALEDEDVKEALTERLDAVQEDIDKAAAEKAIADATAAVENAEESLLEADLAEAVELVEALPEDSAEYYLLGLRTSGVQAKIDNIIAKINNNLEKNDVLLYNALNVKPLTDVKPENIGAYREGIEDIEGPLTLAEIQEVIDDANKAAVDTEVGELVDDANTAVTAVENAKYTDFDADAAELKDQEAFDKLVVEAQKAIDEVPEDYKADEEDEKTVVEVLQARLDEAVRLQADFQEKVLPVVKAEGDIALYNALTANFARVDENLVNEYDEEINEDLQTVEDVQYLIDTVNAEAAVDALFAGVELAEDVTQADIDAAEELVNFIENRGDEDEDGNKTPDETKQGLLDRVKTANELPLKTINELNETKDNSNHENIDTLKQYADILGLDLTEFDKLIPNRGVAAINDLIQNKPTDGYTAETLKPVFDEIVATRLVFEESVKLFATGTEEPLKDLTYITMLIDQLESVSYKTHSKHVIEGEDGLIADLQDLVDRFDALEGKEVVLDDAEEAIDAQKAVLKTIDYAKTSSSTNTRNALKAALTAVENALVQQATPTGFEVVEEKIEITAGEEVEFTIHAFKTVEGEDKVAPFEKFNRTYENVKVELKDGLFFYRDIEFVNGVAKVAVPVTKTDVTEVSIAANAFTVTDEVGNHGALTVTVAVNVGELSEIKVSGEETKELTFTAKDAFGNTIKDFEGNKVVMLPEGAESTVADATGKALVNFEDGVGSIALKNPLTAGTYTFTVGGEEVVIVIPEAEDKE